MNYRKIHNRTIVTTLTIVIAILTLFWFRNTYAEPMPDQQSFSAATQNYRYEVNTTAWQYGGDIIEAKFEPDASGRIWVSVRKENGTSFSSSGKFQMLADDFDNYTYHTSTSSYRCGGIIEFRLTVVSGGDKLKGEAQKCDGGDFAHPGDMYIAASGDIIAGPNSYNRGASSESITFDPVAEGKKGRHPYQAYFQSDNNAPGDYIVSGSVDAWETYHYDLNWSEPVSSGQREYSFWFDPVSLGLTGWHTYQVVYYPSGQSYPIRAGTIRAREVQVQESKLEVRSESIDENGPFYPGSRVRVNAYVRNTGNKSSGTTRLGYWISSSSDGNPISFTDSSPVEALSVNATSAKKEKAVAIPVGISPGRYYVVFEADTDHTESATSDRESVAIDISACASGVRFCDVPTSHTFHDDIIAFSDAKISEGCRSGTTLNVNRPFCPNQYMERGPMAVFLLRGLHGSNYTPPQATRQLFSDVPLNHEWADWIYQLYAEEITSGCASGRYCPDYDTSGTLGYLKRQDLAVFLARMKGWPLNTPAVGVFSDVTGDGTAQRAIEYMWWQGYTNGSTSCEQSSTPSGKAFCPGDYMTRGHVASFMARSLGFVATQPRCATVTTSVSGGGGTVAVSPSSNCPINSSQYRTDTTITLTAQPQSGYRFNSWSGNVGGMSNPVQITIGRTNIAATASFVTDQVINLAPTSISEYNQAPYYPGSSIGVLAGVVNNGADAAPATTLAYWVSNSNNGDPIDGGLVATNGVPPLSVGGQATDLFEDIYIPHGSGMTPGTYYVVVEADYGNNVSKSNEGDNRTSMAFTLSTCNGGTFCDVVEGSTFSEEITALSTNGLTGGCRSGVSPTTFCPQRMLDRAHLAIFLLRRIHGADYDPKSAYRGDFEDVPASHPHALWIEELNRLGLTNGCNGNPRTFCPDYDTSGWDGIVTRGTLALFLGRAEGWVYDLSLSNTFVDVQGNDEMQKATEYMWLHGYTNGKVPCERSNAGDGLTFCPDDFVNRGVAAAFMSRSFGYVSVENREPTLSVIPFDNDPATLAEHLQRCLNDVQVTGLAENAQNYRDVTEFTNSQFSSVSATEVALSICDAYRRNVTHLGEPVSGHNGSVHWWSDGNGTRSKFQVQNFCRKDANGNIVMNGNTCADNIIIYNPSVRAAFVLRDQVWIKYVELFGVYGTLGGPVTDVIAAQLDTFNNPISWEENTVKNDLIGYFENGEIFWRASTNVSQDRYRDVDVYPYLGFRDLTVAFPFGQELARVRNFIASNNPDVSKIIQSKSGANLHQAFDDLCPAYQLVCQERKATRANFVRHIVQYLFGKQLSDDICVGFQGGGCFEDDIKYAEPETWKAFYMLRDREIIKGTSQNYAKPKDYITRAEAISVIIRALTYPNIETSLNESEDDQPFAYLNGVNNPFVDVGSDNTHYNSILTGCLLGIVKGKEDGGIYKFRPDDNINGSEMLLMLTRAFDTPLTPKNVPPQCSGHGQLMDIAWRTVGSGIRWRSMEGDDDLENIAIVDLTVPGITVELAQVPAKRIETDWPQFELHTIRDLVATTGASSGNNQYSPFVAINGTAKERVSIGQVAIQSVLGKDGELYRAPFPDANNDCHAEGYRNKRRPWLTGEDFFLPYCSSFFTYKKTATGNWTQIHTPQTRFSAPYPNLHHPQYQSNDDAHRQTVRVKAETYLISTVNDVDFAVGYDSTIIQDGQQKNSGSLTEHHHTIIGIKYDESLSSKGKYLYLVTVRAGLSSRIYSHLRASGVDHAILLDGGGSSQFLSAGLDGTHYNDVVENDSSSDSGLPRGIINSIVAYNKNVIPGVAHKCIQSEGCKLKMSDRVTAIFSPNQSIAASRSALQDTLINISYIPQPAITTDLENLINTGIVFELQAQDSNSQPIIANYDSYQFEIDYDPTSLPENFNESDLALYYWENGRWIRETTSVIDTDNNIIRASSEKFGLWAVLAERKTTSLTFVVRADMSYTQGNVYLVPINSQSTEEDLTSIPMTDNGDGTWSYTLEVVEGSEFRYLYTRGSLETAEEWDSVAITNTRYVNIGYNTGGATHIDNTATDWGDGPDDEKAVRAWLDPLVTNVTPTAGTTVPLTQSLTVAWSKTMQPDTCFEVMDGSNNAVQGSCSYSAGNSTVTFTPDSALQPNTDYTVVVTGQIAADNAVQQVEYTWDFVTSDETPTETLAPGDIDGNARVELRDVLKVIGMYRIYNPSAPLDTTDYTLAEWERADLYKDGQWNLRDVLEMIELYRAAAP